MIKQTYTIDASASKVWQALVDPKLIKQWTGVKAVMSEKEGPTFKLWGGDIWGTNTKVIAEEFLEQDWFGGDWDVASKVKIKLHANQNGSTTVNLIHDSLPKGQENSFADGWKDYYFEPIKELLENNER